MVLRCNCKTIPVPENIKITIDNSDVNIVCDSDKMEAVFINVVMNSIQAMSNGGTLTIKINPINDFVEINFIDTGDGIPEESIGKIFEPLFTTKQKELVLVWQVVKILWNNTMDKYL